MTYQVRSKDFSWGGGGGVHTSIACDAYSRFQSQMFVLGLNLILIFEIYRLCVV